MARSGALRLVDVRKVFRLVGDCRDLGRDRNAWNSRAIHGLQELSGSMLVSSALQNTSTEPFVEFHNSWFTPWSSQRDQKTWLELIGAGRHLTYPTVQEVYKNAGVSQVISPGRILSSHEWEHSEECNDRRQLGQNDAVISTRWNATGRLHFFSVNRSTSDRNYSTREQKIIRLFHEEITNLFDTMLTTSVDGPLASLPRRLRQVLAALAEGDSEKQIATQLCISKTTVHGYVRELYQRFGVHSRGELLARYYRI